MTKRKNGGIAQAIVAAASRPEGMQTSRPHLNFSTHAIQNNALSLLATGKIHSVGNRDWRRLFIDPEHAKAYCALLPALKAERAKEIAEARRERNRERSAAQRGMREKPAYAKKPAAASMVAKPKSPTRYHYGHAPWKASDPPIITSETIVTICKSPPAFGPLAKLLGIGA
jgi:hypothetical protein